MRNRHTVPGGPVLSRVIDETLAIFKATFGDAAERLGYPA